MTESDSNQTAPSAQGTSSTWPIYVLLAVAAVTLLVVQFRRPGRPNEFVGKPLPPIAVAGWLNAAAPVTNESLRGKLVLVDYWETNCPYCIENMPRLVKLRDKFRERGLVVIGLTPEPGEPEGQLDRYVKSVPGLDWPIGYGAGLTLDAAGIFAFPTYVLYGEHGQAVWGGHDLDELEDVLVEHLARG